MNDSENQVPTSGTTLEKLKGISRPTTASGKFTLLKAKCLVCSLHFIVCTDRPENHRHPAFFLYCPECGTMGGHKIVWAIEVPGFIWELVPGCETVENPLLVVDYIP